MTAPIFKLEATALNAIRSLPPDIYLVHATNCIAEWGAGIAAELATVFPSASKEYKSFCNSGVSAGACQIIPPQSSDVASGAPKIHITEPKDGKAGEGQCGEDPNADKDGIEEYEKPVRGEAGCDDLFADVQFGRFSGAVGEDEGGH
ncbi:ADP-ribose 1''-phosphate phosphatase [Fusarium irregulare]|uniref:ADP-ribose 1''-phosphate phosphatase n=1 Tax=Fusarium irregulare TaxID=2494466 RepID=A0A9W8U5J2_9HYPO|nr:ADP-ribose 1''-phosphate phosphatase [Fusarium irregulare]